MEGSSVYWYAGQRAICSAASTWSEYLSMVVDMFFKKETLAKSCAKGQNRGKKKQETVALNQAIVEAIVGKFRFQSFTLFSIERYRVATESEKFTGVY